MGVVEPPRVRVGNNSTRALNKPPPEVRMLASMLLVARFSEIRYYVRILFGAVRAAVMSEGAEKEGKRPFGGD